MTATLAELRAWADGPTYKVLRGQVPELRRPEQLFGSSAVSRPRRDLFLAGVRACLLAGGVPSTDLDGNLAEWDAAWRRAEMDAVAPKRKSDVRLEIVAALVLIAIGVAVNIATDYVTSALAWASFATLAVLSSVITHRVHAKRPIGRTRWIVFAAASGVVLAASVAFDVTRSRAPTSAAAPDPPIVARVLSVGRDYSEHGDDWVFRDGKNFNQAEMQELARINEDTSAMRAKGAIDPVVLQASLMLEGNAPTGVTVTDMWLRSACSSPLTGTLIHRTPGAGPETNPRLLFDLDTPSPHAMAFPQRGAPNVSYFKDHRINLAYHEQVVVTVDARTLKRYCTFDIIIEASTGRSTRQVRVDRGKAALAVTAYADGASSPSRLKDVSAYQAVYLYDDNRATLIRQR